MNNAIVETKKVVVNEIAEKMQNAESTVVVEYLGLTVKEVEQLRRELRAEGIEFKVYKNTMTRRAADSLGFSDLNTELVGPNAIAFGMTDAVAPARVIAKFAKDHKALKMKAGIVEGNVVDVNVLNELASLPNREGLLSMLLSCLQAPARDMACVVQAIVDKDTDAVSAE